MTSDRWQEIERLYHLARHQDPAKREAFLEQACQGDESLRKEIVSLLASRSEAEGFIESPAVELAARVMAEDQVERHPDLAGRTLLHYRIVKQVGRGGMGEVYQARDLSLGRDVGIKVIPQDFARGPDRISRFRREAKLLASLNHPNIAAIHGLEEPGETQFIVLELVEGETLRDLTERGPVAIRKLVDIAVQIADGMAAAHAGGITHRDLKPANIMLSPDGHVKILDFGLARQSIVSTEAGSETMTVGHTKPGMILGTVHYMSPEQASGKPVDYRSDQFSFGLILYEMASGKKAFDKPESVQTMSAIVSEEAPPIERSIPRPLQWIFDRCLAKDPADRYDSSRDLYRELRNLRDHLSEASVKQAAATTPRSMKWLTHAIAILVGAGLMLGTWLYFAPPPMSDQSAYRFTPFAFDPDGQSGGSWSPDGKAYAYIGRGTEGNGQLSAFLFNQPSLHFAPDGKSILFFFNAGVQQGEEAWLISYPPDPGHPPRRVLRELPGYGGTPEFSWMPDSRRIVLSMKTTPDGCRQLWLADILSDTRQALTSGTSDSRNPAVSPDGQRVVFMEHSSNLDVVSANLDGSPPRELIATERNEMMPAWAAKQPVLVYVTDRNGPPEI